MFNDQELLKISEAINGTWLLVNNQALSDFALDVFLEDIDEFLSRLLLMLGSFVVLCLLLF